MNRIICLGIFCCLVFKLLGQCPEFDLEFNDQNMIDSFIIEYPDCKMFSYNILIDGNEINDLSAFDSIEVIDGNLAINNTISLSSINGFSNLKRINGQFTIANNQIENLNGLSNLNYIGGTFFFYANESSGLSGLNSLDSIVGNLNILESSISTFESIDKIRFIGGGLSVHTTNISNFDGLQNLNSLGGYLRITNNKFLKNLTGLQNIVLIDGELFINTNKELEDISSIENVIDSTFTSVQITYNSKLASCSIENICNYLSLNGPNEIYLNLENCNSEEEILNNCAVNNLYNSLELELEITPNPFHSRIQVNHDNRRAINYHLYNQEGRFLKHGEIFTGDFLNFNDLPKGIYILLVYENSKRTSFKLVKL